MTRPKKVRIVITGEPPLFRDELSRLLEAEAELEVVGQASDGAEAVKLVRQSNPDILLLDLDMPVHPGVQALRELSQPANATPVRVIVLTAAAEKTRVVEALRLGARGVVLKDSSTQLLVKAIQTVMAGAYFVGRESVSNLRAYLGGPEDADAAGIAVKKPRHPNLNSGSAAASLDDVFG